MTNDDETVPETDERDERAKDVDAREDDVRDERTADVDRPDEREDRKGERLTTADLARGSDEVEESSDRDEDSGAGERQPLFAGDDAERFRGRWSEIQIAFVDEPRRAVEDADELVAELMQRLAETFASERSTLESQWDREGDVSTEDLRVGLQRYRSFFDRLLSA